VAVYSKRQLLEQQEIITVVKALTALTVVRLNKTYQTIRETKELLKKIDDMVKESARQKQKENELKGRITNAQQMVKQNNLKFAKRYYENIKPLYYSLPDESKKTVYPLITALQRDIAALEMKIKQDSEHSLEKEERILLEKMRALR